MSADRSRLSGYTIVEVMIFLAVTGMLLGVALTMIGRQQQRTQFNQSVHDIQSKIEDVLNDVSTGFYSNTNNFHCKASDTPGDRPDVKYSGTNPQGSNTNCIFLGKVIQFAPETGADQYRIFTVVGRQYKSKYATSEVVKSFSDAVPTMVFNGTASVVSEDEELEYGLEAKSLSYQDGTSKQTGAIGIFTRLSDYSTGVSGTGLATSAQNIDVIPIPNTKLGDFSSVIKSNTDSLVDSAAKNVPIELCFDSGDAASGIAIITIATNHGNITTNLTITNDGTSCT